MDSNSFHTQRRLRQSDADSYYLWKAMDAFFLLNAGSLVFFMLCGFSMRCAGFVRKKNARSVVVVHFLAASVAAIGFYLFGFGFAFGDGDGGNSFLGTENFALKDAYDTTYTHWFFHFAFAASTAAIVSGAVAERMKIEAQLLSTLILTTWVCPVVMRWVWYSDGWLCAWTIHDSFKDVGMIDFAGAGIVHLVGGVASLAGAAIVGRRVGRSDANGKPLDIPGHSAALSSLGVLILWFGWYGFNPGSVLTLQARGHAIAARCAVTTALSAASGCISTLTILLVRNFIRKGRLIWDVIGAGNGVLAGLVAISASCAVVEPWAAIVIGIVAGLVYTGASYLVLHVFKLDDPVNAVAIHGFCGIWSLIAASAFAEQDHDRDVRCAHYYNEYCYDNRDAYGFLRGGDGKYLVSALVGILAISGWVLLHMVVVFFILKALGLLRVSAIEEHEGLDSHCGLDRGIPNSTDAQQPLLTETELVQIHGSPSNTQNTRYTYFKQRFDNSKHESENWKPKIGKHESTVTSLFFCFYSQLMTSYDINKSLFLAM